MSKAGQLAQKAVRTWRAYRLRWKRRELLWRAIRSVRRLTPVVTRVTHIRPGDVLLFAIIRNEAARLPEFLSHYRALGVAHFLVIDNCSRDGSSQILRAQSDVSLWRSDAAYRATRFGMDLIGALLLRYGHGHWCLTVDADELLVYPGWDSTPLDKLTAELDQNNVKGIGALMLDLYPRNRVGAGSPRPGAPMTEQLPWFDSGPYRVNIAEPKQNRIVRGGVRERVFFSDTPELSPTLNKLPLIRWHWRYAYVNSTHSLLPPALNALYDGPGDPRFSAVLLHGKFSPEIVSKSHEELTRQQHFHDPDLYAQYHQAIGGSPLLWCDQSARYRDWRQLVAMGLMSDGSRSIIDERTDFTLDPAEDKLSATSKRKIGPEF